MNYISLIFLGSILMCEPSIAENPIATLPSDPGPPSADIRVQFCVFILDKLDSGLISADSAWEVFSSLTEDSVRDKVLAFINIVSEKQKLSSRKIEGYRVRPKGPLMRDLSLGLAIQRDSILKKFCSQIPGNENREDVEMFDFRKFFLGLNNGDVEKLIKETGQSPQTNSDAESISTASGDAKSPAAAPRQAEQGGGGQPATRPESK